jgi:hypothetical protein
MTLDAVMHCPDYLRLNDRVRREYNDPMAVIGELGRRGVPRAIPAEELQRTLGSNPVFCSWNAWNSEVSDLTTGWPFLFSHPLLGANKQPAH